MSSMSSLAWNIRSCRALKNPALLLSPGLIHRMLLAGYCFGIRSRRVLRRTRPRLPIISSVTTLNRVNA